MNLPLVKGVGGCSARMDKWRKHILWNILHKGENLKIIVSQSFQNPHQYWYSSRNPKG